MGHRKSLDAVSIAWSLNFAYRHKRFEGYIDVERVGLYRALPEMRLLGALFYVPICTRMG